MLEVTGDVDRHSEQRPARRGRRVRLDQASPVRVLDGPQVRPRLRAGEDRVRVAFAALAAPERLRCRYRWGRERDNVRYWSNLFTYDTWTRRHPRKASWAANRHKTATELAPGDTVIAYIARIGWTGAYRTTSTTELNASGPFGDEYPLLADIEPIAELEPEEALTIADLPDDAPLRRWPGGPIYPNLVQSSGSELSAEHGAFLVDTLTMWRRNPPTVR